MRNLLIITQKVDEEDDLLGFFVDWIREFSGYFDNVFVVTLFKGKYNLPPNVQVCSLGKERNNSRLIRFINFYKLIFKFIPQSDGIFAHMSPVFVIASWPIAFMYGKKIVLWYLHRSVTLRLKIAEMLCYKIVTAAKESLKFQSQKIVETGHGINIDKFITERNWKHEGALRILSVGRISKIKNYETLLKTAKILKDRGVEVKIKIVGQPVMPKDNEYLKSLHLLVSNYQLQNVVHFVGFISYNQIPPYYKEANVVIGLTPDGGIDKTILEGMASGCLVFTSNNACLKYFGKYSDQLIFGYNDPESLAGKISASITLSSENKKEISDFLIKSVSEHHLLKNVISRITSLYD